MLIARARVDGNGAVRRSDTKTALDTPSRPSNGEITWEERQPSDACTGRTRSVCVRRALRRRSPFLPSRRQQELRCLKLQRPRWW